METYIKRAKKGDIEAFINLMDINKTYMYKVAKSILNNNEDIADAIQETILSCYKNIEKLKEIKYFKTWMTRILINKCNDVIRANKNIIYIEQEKEELFNYAKKEEGYSENIEQSVSLRECFDRLKPDYKIVMIMYYDQGFNSKEISEILNINESTVRTRMARGRDYLREHYLKMDREA